jgi:hypothetical protein
MISRRMASLTVKSFMMFWRLLTRMVFSPGGGLASG